VKIHQETVKELGTVLIRLGEAAVVGGVATFFVPAFPRWASSSSLVLGAILVFSGLYAVNKSHLAANVSHLTEQ